MTLDERVLYIFNRLRDASVTFAGACGILGNLQGETHDFNPMSLETSYASRFGLTNEEYVRRADNGLKVYNNYDFAHDSAGFGIAQWTWYGRKQNLLNYAKAQGKSVGDLGLQIDFMIKEMKENYRNTWKVCTTTNSYIEAVKICVTEYEKPANQAEQIKKRSEYAKVFYNKYKDTPTEEKKPISNSYSRAKIIALAHSEVGYMEKKTNSQLDDKVANAGSNNYTKYARDLDKLGNFYNGTKNGYAWCDVFVDWLFVKCFGPDKARELLCQPLKSSGAGCIYSYQYYQRAGQAYKRVDKPEVGDQIFFGSGPSNCTHTGIVYKIDDNRVYTIEGNTSGAEGVVPNGGCVCRKSYARNHIGIVGYGRPAYNDGFTGNAIEADEVKIPIDENDGEYPKLQLGDTGTKVKLAQELLIKKGYSCGPAGADGEFGQGTLNAVKTIQKNYGLTVNGVIDTKTWTILLTSNEKPIEKPKKDNVSAPIPTKSQFDRQLLINVAMAEVGYSEKRSEKQLDDRDANAGTANFNKYARDLDAIKNYYYHDRKQGLNWCDIFCDWCFVKAYGENDSFTVNCQPQYSYGAGCPESLAYYKAQGRLDMKPQIGDQFFLSDGMGSTGHTGLVVGVSNTMVDTIEGNQRLREGVDGVVKKKRFISEIVGFGHPIYNDGYGTDDYIGKITKPDLSIVKPEPDEPIPKPVPDEPIENSPKFVPPKLKYGNKGDNVKKLQALLKYNGFSIGWTGIDGSFGRTTEKAIKKVQAKLGREQNGIADQYVWAYLINE